MPSMLVWSLALLPPLLAATWIWFQLLKAEKDVGAWANFEGMHLED